MDYQVFNEPPEDFDSRMQGSGCYCEYEDKVLLLKRHPSKYEGNTWGVPGGKFEKGEDARSAVIREVYEEVGLNIEAQDLVHIGTFYIRDPKIDYIFHMFRKPFVEKPSIILELEEHLEAKWVTIEEALKLPLIKGGKETLMHYKGILLNDKN